MGMHSCHQSSPGRPSSTVSFGGLTRILGSSMKQTARANSMGQLGLNVLISPRSIGIRAAITREGGALK
jgi:hypothetical protein